MTARPTTPPTTDPAMIPVVLLQQFLVGELVGLGPNPTKEFEV
jgi:hypothetical protein